MQLNMVLGQREVYALDPHSRARLNAVYMTSILRRRRPRFTGRQPAARTLRLEPLSAAVAVLPALALALFLSRKADG